MTSRIYVADLAAYNAGTLYGVWIDADQDAGTIQEEIKAMLRKSPIPGAEEYAIHDYEGFGEIRISELESIERVAAIAQAIVEYSDAFAAWLAHNPYGEIERFHDAYAGKFYSAGDYAEEFVRDCYPPIPDHLRDFIDWERMANDWVVGGNIIVVRAHDGGVYVYDNNV